MKTPRVAKDTAKVASSLCQDDYAPRRQTRSFAATLQTFSANEFPPTKGGQVKHEDTSDSESSLSAPSTPDIEDPPFGASLSSRKRKRGHVTPSSAVTSFSTSTTTQTSPRKAGIKGENGASDEKLKKTKRQPARRIVKADGEVTIEPPSNWREIYDAVLEMRKDRTAPVDTMGCERLADEHLEPKDQRFQTLIALMLSSQTKDTTNALTMRRLQRELPFPGLTLTNILAVEPEKLNEMIYAVGFHNNKTRYIKAAAEILRDEYHGDIPDTIEGLMSLPGVGPKMGYLCLSAAWGKTQGIGVDVHVHRITNLWRWHKTKNPEETRASLESWLPKERWHEINHLLVGFGQTTCLPVGRKCGNCTLSVKGLCASAVVDGRVSVKKVKKETVKKVEAADEGDGFKSEEVEEAVVVKEEEVVAEDVALRLTSISHSPKIATSPNLVSYRFNILPAKTSSLSATITIIERPNPPLKQPTSPSPKAPKQIRLPPVTTVGATHPNGLSIPIAPSEITTLATSILTFHDFTLDTWQRQQTTTTDQPLNPTRSRFRDLEKSHLTAFFDYLSVHFNAFDILFSDMFLTITCSPLLPIHERPFMVAGCVAIWMAGSEDEESDVPMEVLSAGHENLDPEAVELGGDIGAAVAAVTDLEAYRIPSAETLGLVAEAFPEAKFISYIHRALVVELPRLEEWEAVVARLGTLPRRIEGCDLDLRFCNGELPELEISRLDVRSAGGGGADSAVQGDNADTNAAIDSSDAVEAVEMFIPPEKIKFDDLCVIDSAIIGPQLVKCIGVRAKVEETAGKSGRRVTVCQGIYVTSAPEMSEKATMEAMKGAKLLRVKREDGEEVEGEVLGVVSSVRGHLCFADVERVSVS